MEHTAKRTALGWRISEAASHADMTLSQLADAIGVGRNSLSYIVTGRTKDPKCSILKRIAQVTDVSLDWLLDVHPAARAPQH